MTMHRSSPRIAAAVAAVAMLVAACGSGANEDDDADTSAASEPDEAASETADDAPDETSSTDDGAAAGEVTIGTGVTEEPCPDAVNDDNGCIYLGTLSDLTEGPFASLGPAIVESQTRFWQQVNENGGIGGAYDVDATTYVQDNKYNPEVQAQRYSEIEPEILAIAQTLGSPTTAAILGDMTADQVIGVPGSWSSIWEFEDTIMEAGASYCIESMNAIDYYAQEVGEPTSIVAVGYPGDFGEDGAAGASIAADAYGAEFTFVEQIPVGAGGTTDGAIGIIVDSAPDVVIITTGPGEMSEIVGNAVARGYEGQFIGTSPTWTPSLLESPAAEALVSSYWQSAPWEGVAGSSEGHDEMRAAFEGEDLSPGFAQGWGWSYPMLTLLESAVERGDLTRQGLVDALAELESVDYRGFLPEGAGNYTGDPNDQAGRYSVISVPDGEVAGGVRTVQEPFIGPTAESYEMAAPCYESVDLRG